MRITFLTHRLPFAPNRGDRIRAYHLLRELTGFAWEVELVSLVHERGGSGTGGGPVLEALGIRTTVAPVALHRAAQLPPGRGLLALPGRDATHPVASS